MPEFQAAFVPEMYKNVQEKLYLLYSAALIHWNTDNVWIPLFFNNLRRSGKCRGKNYIYFTGNNKNNKNNKNQNT